jgi:hypothetical protein
MGIGNNMNVPDKYYLKGTLLLDERNQHWNKIQKICKEKMNPMIVLDKESSWNYIKQNTDYYLQRAIYNNDAIIETWDDVYIRGHDVKYLLLIILGRYYINKDTIVISDVIEEVSDILRFNFGIYNVINDNRLHVFRRHYRKNASFKEILFNEFKRYLYRFGFDIRSF